MERSAMREPYGGPDYAAAPSGLRFYRPEQAVAGIRTSGRPRQLLPRAVERPVREHDRPRLGPLEYQRRQPRAGDQILRRVARAEVDVDESRLLPNAWAAELQRLADVAEDQVVAVGDAFR